MQCNLLQVQFDANIRMVKFLHQFLHKIFYLYVDRGEMLRRNVTLYAKKNICSSCSSYIFSFYMHAIFYNMTFLSLKIARHFENNYSLKII